MRQPSTTTPLKVEVGKAIRRLRVMQNLSLRRFGMMTGIDYQYMSLIEKGCANPTIDKLDKIARALDVEVRDLFQSR